MTSKPDIFAPCIVTHNGNAHLDEYLATAWLKAKYPHLGLIRTNDKNPNLPFFIEHEEYYVVDIGRKHDPTKNNFDHHQFSSDEKPTCAFSLVLKAHGVYEDALQAWNWLKNLEVYDSKGPVALKSALNCREADFDPIGILSPLEKMLLAEFSEVGTSIVGHWWNTGSMLHESFNSYANMKALVCSPAVQWITLHTNNGSVSLVIVSKVVGPAIKAAGFMALTRLLKSIDTSVAIIATADTRGDGYSLVRVDDNHKVDFRRVDGDIDVDFVHANGFLAKTAIVSEKDVIRLCRKASTSGSNPLPKK